VHTVGGVIDKGEAVMQIVPRADELVIETRVDPSDIDQVAVGANAVVRVMAGNVRITPQIVGVVSRVSADLASEQEQKSAQPPPPFYTVRIVLPAEEVARLGDLHLVPGMPTETFIRTKERTPFEILFKPLREQLARTFRER
jgi:HlyD family secretion protein